MRLNRAEIVRFASELRRRKVIRVAIGYAAAAWVTIEVASTVLPELGAPPGAVRWIVWAAVLGFPAAMVFAWIFDISPSGLHRTLDAPLAPPVRARREPSIDGVSIAALPFIDRSPDGDHQHLADGITEEIINGLARVPGFRVVARTSSFAFRGREGDARAIGDALGVAYLVEGSLRVAGGRMRLNVQLVDVEDGYTAWSQPFDRRVDDIFEVQEEVARRIVDELGSHTTPAGASAIRARGDALLDRSTASVAAYDLYLRGRVHWSERSPPSLRRAIEFFRAALERDATFAHAHAGLADCYAVLLDYGVLAPAAALDEARRHAAEALRLAPDLAEAHGSTAIVAQIEWRWRESEDAFRRALELNPGYAIAHHRYALLLAWQGRFDDARAALDRGLRTDPVSPAIAATAGFVNYFARDLDRARDAEQRTLDRFPTLGLARIALGMIHLARDEADLAITAFQQVLAAAPGSESSADGSAVQSLLALALARAGRTTEAEHRLDRLESGDFYASAYYRALPHIGLGRFDAALDRLEAAVAERCPQLVYVGTDPVVDPLRANPRFEQVLREVGLTPVVRAE